MTRSIQDWLNDHIDALLGDRSAAPAAREADTEEQTRLMKTVRQLKLGAEKDEPQPDADFVSRLENEMLQAMPQPRPQQPKVVRPPFWGRSWFRPVAGVTTAAAALFLAVLLLRSAPLMPAAPSAAPAPSVLREQAKAPAPAAAPSAAPAAGASQDAASQAKGAGSAAGAAAAVITGSKPLPDLVAQAQTIFVGRVVTASPASPQPSGASASVPLRVVFSVERYLKGSPPTGEVRVLTGSPEAPGPTLMPGQRVLVMAGPANSSSDLPLLPDPQSAYILTPDGQAIAAGAPGRSAATAHLTESDLIAQIQAIVKGGQ